MQTKSFIELLHSDALTISQARQLIVAQQAQIETQQAKLETQQARIDELQKQIERLKSDDQGSSAGKRLDASWSMNAEAKRQAQKEARKKRGKRDKKLKRGRLKTADKIALASRTETVFPDHIARELCSLSHTRVAWRLENGRAVLVAYEIYRYRNAYGKPAGLIGRSEYGIEILLALAYQVYCVGISIDKACQLLAFFEQLNLKKSQADALLNQLSRAWEKEFDSLCTLLANSAVVNCDETSWSINSVWAFLTDKLTVVFYGVHKDAQTLQQIIDKSIFQGVLASDNAAVYNGFSLSQKCWAHLIRKAIKLTLLRGEEPVYRELTDRLLAIYAMAKKIKADGRLGDAGRASRVAELDDMLLELCAGGWVDPATGGSEPEDDYRRLCKEIVELMLARELFTFVLVEQVEGTNNVSERQLRDDATARKTGRTSKTARGARRQSIISSVLQSIGKVAGSFNLESVIDEVKRWTAVGQSCFEELVKQLGLETQQTGLRILDRIILNADPTP